MQVLALSRTILLPIWRSLYVEPAYLSLFLSTLIVVSLSVPFILKGAQRCLLLVYTDAHVIESLLHLAETRGAMLEGGPLVVHTRCER